MRAEGALDRQAIHLLRPGPALGRAQHDGWPARAARHRCRAVGAGLALDVADAPVAGIERRREVLMYARRVVALHERDRVAVAFEQRAHVVVARPAQRRRTADLVAV